MLAEASLERRKGRKGIKTMKIKKKEFKKMLKEARGEAYSEGYDLGYDVGYQDGVEKAESLWKVVSDVLIEKIAELSDNKKESRLYMFSNALAEKLTKNGKSTADNIVRGSSTSGFTSHVGLNPRSNHALLSLTASLAALRASNESSFAGKIVYRRGSRGKR